MPVKNLLKKAVFGKGLGFLCGPFVLGLFFQAVAPLFTAHLWGTGRKKGKGCGQGENT